MSVGKQRQFLSSKINDGGIPPEHITPDQYIKRQTARHQEFHINCYTTAHHTGGDLPTFVLFCRPVAPNKIILFNGNVGKVLPHSRCILSNSVVLMIDTFEPVSIINLAGMPSTSALTCIISLLKLLVGLLLSSSNNSCRMSFR